MGKKEMSKKYCLWRKTALFASLFFLLGLTCLWPSADAKAYYYANTKKNVYDHWTGYKNSDGTFTVTGYDSIATNAVLQIPAQIGGMLVTQIGGTCTVAGCAEEYCENNAIFNYFSPASVTELIIPDTVKCILEYGDEASIFREFTNLQKLHLPNNSVFSNFNVGNEEYLPKLTEVSMPNNVLSGDTTTIQTIQKIHFYDGATYIECENGNYPNLTEIDLPSTIQEFEWSYSPKLTTLNCDKALDEINITGLYKCENLHIPVTVDFAAASDDASMDYSYSGITELNIRNMYSDAFIMSDGIAGCRSLKAINILSKTANCNYYTEDGILYYYVTSNIGEKYKVLRTYPGGKSTEGNYTLPEDIIGFDGNAFNACKFTSITIPENINPLFFWVYASPGTFFSDSYKIRVVKQSAACRYEETAEELGNWIYNKSKIMFGVPEKPTVSPSRIEFYKGSVYTISYVLGEGGRNPISNPKSYQAGDDIIELKDPERPGYTFLGWKRNDVSGDYMNTTQNMSQFQNYVFTAVWKKNEDKTPDSETADSEAPESETAGSETTDPQTAGSETPSVPTGPLEQGSIIQGASGESYKVTGADTVEFMRPAKNKATVNVPNSIKKDGTSYIVTSIAPNAFKNNKRLKKVVINGNLQKIGANAFYGCKKLRTVSFTNGLTSIGPKAFYKCAGLTKVDLPSSLKSIGKQAFYGCKKLKKINIWMNQIIKNKIGSKAFSGIYKGVTVTIYNNRTKFKSIKMILNAKGMPAQAKYKSKISF